MPAGVHLTPPATGFMDFSPQERYSTGPLNERYNEMYQ